MALRWIEGFETFGAAGRSGADLRNDLILKYPQSSLPYITPGLIAGRNGGMALNDTSSNVLIWYLDNQSTWTIGLAFKAGDFGYVRTILALLPSFGDYPAQCELRRNGSGYLEVYSGDVVRATGATMLQPGQWYYIEWKATIADSGSTEVRVNRSVDIAATGVDLQGRTSSGADTLELYLQSGGLDDIYIADGTAGINDFLGEVRIEAILPSADYGTPNWTPSAGADHYALVDDNPADGDATYLTTDTTGNKDLFQYGDVAGHVLAVQVNTRARVDGTARNLTAVVQSGGTEYDQAAGSVGLAAYREFSTLLVQDPATLATWTAAGVNGAQFGIKLTA